MERVPKTAALTRPEFHAALREWHGYAASGDEIAAGKAHARSPWIWVKHLGNRYFLHSDTHRDGVGGYLVLVERDGETIPWSTVENERGVMNKVAFGKEQAVIPGFYLYRAV